MNLLFCRWKSICEPDMLLAWKALGCTVDEFDEKISDVDYSIEYLNRMSEKLMTGNYDMVFSVDFIPVTSKVCQIFKIYYVSYIVDCPLVQLYSNALYNEWNRVFIFDLNMYNQFHQRNPGKIFHLPLASNISHFDSICKGISIQDKHRFRSEISFVGSLYIEKSPYNKLTTLSDKLKGYFDGIIESQLKIYGYNFLSEVLSEDIVKEFKQCVKIEDEHEDPNYHIDYPTFIAQEFLGIKCSELERIRFLDKLSNEYKIDLYTQSDTTLVPKVNCRGSAESRIEMPKIFNLSEINLNITLKSIQTGISQRVWDVLAAGGFLITNYQTELPEYFDIGKDLVIYESYDDLKEKIKFYLEHEDLRKEIAENGHEKIRKYHTYEKRFQTILSILHLK